MDKYYLTADKIGAFVERMWQAGIGVHVEPERKQLTIILPDGRYEWVHVFDKGSFDGLCNAFITPTDAPKTEA